MDDHRLLQERGEVGHHHVRAVPAQRVGLAHAIDADDVAEVPGAPGVDAGERVLEHHRLRRVDAERARGGEERVGRRLAGEMLLGGDDAVDAYVEQVVDAGGLEHLPAVLARRDDRRLAALPCARPPR